MIEKFNVNNGAVFSFGSWRSPRTEHSSPSAFLRSAFWLHFEFGRATRFMVSRCLLRLYSLVLIVAAFVFPGCGCPRGLISFKGKKVIFVFLRMVLREVPYETRWSVIGATNESAGRSKVSTVDDSGSWHSENRAQIHEKRGPFWHCSKSGQSNCCQCRLKIYVDSELCKTSGRKVCGHFMMNDKACNSLLLSQI
jgi:hypothetical protein